MKFSLWLLLFFTVGLFVPPAAGSAGLKKATLLPQWFPQAQFAGYYVAFEKGLYKKHGIDLNILRGGPERSFRKMLADGQADFATQFLSTGIEQRSQGFRIVSIGQIVQRSGLMLVAKKSSGIHVPADLDGRKLSLWQDFELQPRAFFRKYNLRVEVIPQTYTLNLFLRGGVDAASAMWYNEYHSILNAGIDENELTTFFFDRHGLNFPEDAVFCLEDTWRRDPALCCAFMKATIEGWQYAFAHPEEALDIVMKYVNEAMINTSRIHQKWMFERMRDLILPQGKNRSLGRLSEADYQTVSREMQQAGIIKTIPPYGAFHVDCQSQ
ncbi:MAG: ABC transporter substrate-binding protein [Syntrophus sp. (in: bacteria)]|nr:ABC transporter substrate-binding protein [Syntrophus sp. (in: bacteria)]